MARLSIEEKEHRAAERLRIKAEQEPLREAMKIQYAIEAKTKKKRIKEAKERLAQIENERIAQAIVAKILRQYEQ